VPILPMQEGRIERRSHDYYRHGTTTLFAALDIAAGHITAALKPKHRNQEFVARAYRHVFDDEPVELHLVMDTTQPTNSPTSGPGWPRTHGSSCTSLRPNTAWMNLVEVFFSIVERQAIRRGVLKSVKDLNTKIRPSSTAGTNEVTPSSGPRPPKRSSGKPTVQQLQIRVTRPTSGNLVFTRE